MSAPEAPLRTDAGQADSLAAWLRWTRFRSDFGAALRSRSPSVDLRALGQAFWAWAAVLERDASFEALDPVDYAHFAAGQLLTRLLTQRPILVPAQAPEVEARVLTDAVIDRLQAWRRALGAPALDGVPVAADSAAWASFLENIAEEPDVAVAFLDDFTGREPVWRYPQLIAERPAMRRARQAAR